MRTGGGGGKEEGGNQTIEQDERGEKTSQKKHEEERDREINRETKNETEKTTRKTQYAENINKHETGKSINEKNLMLRRGENKQATNRGKIYGEINKLY